jgi:NAD(P)H dehydrogenase (quinone)
MNVGIIVYSQTGHTLEVCEQLKAQLIGKGHTVTLERVTVMGGRTPQTKTFELENQPDVERYEGVVFASYVEAFSLCQVMARYLKNVGSLQGKHVACLATQQFPYPWMGGNGAIRQMKKSCESKGATVHATGIVNWAKSRRDATMASTIDRLSSAF